MDTRKERMDLDATVAFGPDTAAPHLSDTTQHIGTAKESTTPAIIPMYAVVPLTSMVTVTVTTTHSATSFLEPTNPPTVASQPDQCPRPSCRHPMAALVPALALLSASLCYFMWKLYKFQHWRVASQHRATIGPRIDLKSAPDPLALALSPVSVRYAQTGVQPASSQPFTGADTQRVQSHRMSKIAGKAEAELPPCLRESTAVLSDPPIEASHTHGKKSEVLEHAVQGIEASRGMVSHDSTGVVQMRRRRAPKPDFNASPPTSDDERPDIFSKQREYARRKYASSDEESD